MSQVDDTCTKKCEAMHKCLVCRLRGIDDAIACVRSRLAYYELYREPGPMRTRPEMFAAFAEMLTLLEAMRGRVAREESP